LAFLQSKIASFGIVASFLFLQKLFLLAKICISFAQSKVFAEKFRLKFEKCNLCFHFAIKDYGKLMIAVRIFGKVTAGPYLCP